MSGPRSYHRTVPWLAAVALSLCSATSQAAGTSPTLALVAVDAFASTDGGRLVTADGAFNFADLVQIPFPAAGLLVTQGAHFARFDVDGGTREGTSALVADGVLPSELPTVLAAGGAAGAPSRVMKIEPSRVSVTLPASFAPGTATVVLFAIHENESFVSNALQVELP
jgi:hypothetical protein